MRPYLGRRECRAAVEHRNARGSAHVSKSKRDHKRLGARTKHWTRSRWSQKCKISPRRIRLLADGKSVEEIGVHYFETGFWMLS